jgi:hypothetical protein
MSGPELQQQLAKERAQARAHHRQRRSLRRWPKKSRTRGTDEFDGFDSRRNWYR